MWCDLLTVFVFIVVNWQEKNWKRTSVRGELDAKD